MHNSNIKLIACIFIFYFLETTILLAQPKTISLLHTNDMHANFIPHEAFWVKGDPKPLIGGYNELYFIVDSLRKVKSATILVDNGDVMTGNPITEYVYKGAEGGALFEMMNRIGYSAWTPGNHDFDISVDNLRKLTQIAKFPTISANVTDSSGNFPVNNREFIIIEKNGLKIGLIGIISSDFYNLVNKNSSAGIKILSPIETVKRILDKLIPLTDLQIALTHQGVDDDSILAMHATGLDVILGGHSHTRLRNPKKINNVLIAQAGSNCEYLGVLDLTIENKKITAHDGKLIPLWYNAERPKTDLSRFIDSIKEQIDKDFSEVIGLLKTDWKRGRGETDIGNFITDAQREAANADVGFMNPSGIRKDKSAGPITKKDLFEILPFRNILVKFELTGKQIQSIIEYTILNKSDVLTSGIQCEWKKSKNGGIEFILVTVNGKLLELNKTYIGAASDYFMGEAKRYLGIETPNITYLNQTVFSAVEKKIREVKEILPINGKRIKNVK